MKKILLAFMLICSINAFSQADDPADGDGTVPVDGGVTLLLAAGAAFGVRRMKRQIRKSS
jgi:MYXO-CTERM domain-containing protein